LHRNTDHGGSATCEHFLAILWCGHPGVREITRDVILGKLAKLARPGILKISKRGMICQRTSGTGH
jgi:hypothetical protein